MWKMTRPSAAVDRTETEQKHVSVDNHYVQIKQKAVIAPSMNLVKRSGQLTLNMQLFLEVVGAHYLSASPFPILHLLTVKKILLYEKSTK